MVAGSSTGRSGSLYTRMAHSSFRAIRQGSVPATPRQLFHSRASPCGAGFTSGDLHNGPPFGIREKSPKTSRTIRLGRGSARSEALEYHTEIEPAIQSIAHTIVFWIHVLPSKIKLIDEELPELRSFPCYPPESA
jgi:hypothetical protein